MLGNMFLCEVVWLLVGVCHQACQARSSECIIWQYHGRAIGLDAELLLSTMCRYRKTVNAYDRHGRRTAVNAQQYAVLVTNVNAPCYPEFAPKKDDGG